MVKKTHDFLLILRDNVSHQMYQMNYIGETRVASKMNFDDTSTSYEEIHTYYYHSDHLGSSNVVTDYEGEVYEHLEYTPYGETWVHDQSEDDLGLVDYQFTSKEYDEETGLYYMSARYMNPVASRWASSDPAGWGLINPMDGDFSLRGGFSIIESQNSYSYVSNNPVIYKDETGYIAETVWDIASLTIGIASLGVNISQGDTKGIILDSLGIVADAAAIAVPGLPGGASYAIKASRAAKALDVASNAADGVDSAVSLGQSIADGDAAGIAVNSIGVASSIAGLSGVTDKVADASKGASRASGNAGASGAAFVWAKEAKMQENIFYGINIAETAGDTSEVVQDYVTE
jgi:RHS repeat-associated protein